MSPSRLDTRLVADGLAPTRSRARDLVLRGFVQINGIVCRKPAQACAADAEIAIVDGAPQFVSRGAEKLSAALDHFSLSPVNAIAVDIGASTGGFTEVLLEAGAKRVYAVDVGTAQLHERLRQDPRVIVLEQTDARALSSDVIKDKIDFIVADVSFISLTKALSAVFSLATRNATLVALVKPQFEVGRDGVSSGGIVRDEAVRNKALADVAAWIDSQPGWSVTGTMSSPILGGSGNAEFLLAATRNG